MTGDFILSIASIMIARLNNDDVTIILSTVGLEHRIQTTRNDNDFLTGVFFFSCECVL